MTNLSKKLREYLEEYYTFGTLTVDTRQVSNDGTEKFLFKLSDGNLIETVLMRHNYGNSVCVTTQLGCNIGCSFCASGLEKKKRDAWCLYPEYNKWLVKTLEELEIPLVYAKEEADTYLTSGSEFDIIISSDSDLLILGANVL